MPGELSVHRFSTPADWERWLEEHHASSPGIWLEFAKKENPTPSVVYAEALDGALCYGWIDGQVARGPEGFYRQRFTPRRARSVWSQRNREHISRLEAEGRMREAGRLEVERARSDGRWDRAYASASKIEVPPDLQAALDASPVARDFFQTLTGPSRYAILYRLHNAKRPETRERRLKQFVAMLEAGETFYPKKKP